MSDADIAEFFAELSANLVEPLPLDALPVYCRDADDDHIRACALGGGANVSVTGGADLLALDGDPALGDPRILTPRTFLEMMDVLDAS